MDTKVKSNRKGNPNIGKYRKTGPRTLAGKARSAANLPTAFRSGNHSKLLDLQRAGGCDKCLLGVKEVRKTINGSVTTLTTSPICKFYKKGSMECKLPIGDMTNYMRNYSLLVGDREKDALKLLAIDLIKDGKNAEIVETLSRGKTGHYTLENKKAAADIIMQLLKMDNVQKIQTENKNLNINIEGSLSEEELFGDIEDD